MFYLLVCQSLCVYPCFGCKWSREHGRYFAWIQKPEAATNPSVSSTVDQIPHRAYLCKY